MENVGAESASISVRVQGAKGVEKFMSLSDEEIFELFNKKILPEILEKKNSSIDFGGNPRWQLAVWER